VTGFQMALVCQEGWALHEEWGEGGEREIGHRIGRVLAPPRVGQDMAVAAQRGDEAVLDLHRHVESEIARRANRANRVAGRFSGGVAVATHQREPIDARSVTQTEENRSNSTREAK
jgi:hypothetical protein